VGVVTFSDSVLVPPGNDKSSDCYSYQLAAATSPNLNYLRGFVNSIQEYGSTHYSTAFEAAFDLLEASRPQQGEPYRVILFLTDGEPTDDAATEYDRKQMIMKVIQNRNLRMGNEVIIMTYGLGDDVGLDFLQDIALQNGTKYGVVPDTSVGEIRPGRYVHVSDPSMLATVMASYYDYFYNDHNSEDPVFSAPFRSAPGTDLLTTATLPVIYNEELKGVVGVDLSLSDITADLTYMRHGQLSYPFLFNAGSSNTEGRTLIHPLLPPPAVDETSSVFVHITSLEREDAFRNDVYQKAINENVESGNVTYLAKRYLPRGDSTHDGVNTIEVESTVHWTKAQPSPFIIGLSIATNDSHTYLKPKLPSEQSAVKFGPEAFLDPAQYLEIEEQEYIVNSYSNYMNDNTGTAVNHFFKDGIKDTVVGTHVVDDIWVNDVSGIELYTLLRYIGTYDGVFRMYPGVKLKKKYDPTTRPWYIRAKSNKGLTTLSTPYSPGGGPNHVITLSHTLIGGNQSHHATSDEVIGVMGLDLTLTYFYRLLTMSYSQCMQDKYRCFVVDNNGYFVVHQDFFNGLSKVSDVHITQLEPSIAQDLIYKRVMVLKDCIDMQGIERQHYYEVAINNSRGVVDNIKSKDDCTKYQLLSIPLTNAFLGIVEISADCKQTACYCTKNHQCQSTSVMQCKCPCTSSVSTIYDFCDGAFTLTSNHSPPCPPPVEGELDIQLSSTTGAGKDKMRRDTGIPSCFDPQCESRDSYNDCFGIISCAWCNADISGNDLESPYCTTANQFIDDLCAYNHPTSKPITEPPPLPSDMSKREGGGLSGGAIAGIVIGVLLAVVIIGLITRRFIRKENERRSERRRNNQERSTSVDPEYTPVPSAPPPPNAPPPSNPYINVPMTSIMTLSRDQLYPTNSVTFASVDDVSVPAANVPTDDDLNIHDDIGANSDGDSLNVHANNRTVDNGNNESNDVVENGSGTSDVDQQPPPSVISQSSNSEAPADGDLQRESQA
uniref:VWFA and cache domain-containing protein 1-like n=1 Tax=Saccoglossus kowalevskii TaxID=10224 RepID=A0ABM0MXQ2_SACKO